MNDFEVVYCSECGCTLDSDYANIGVCEYCLDGERDEFNEDYHDIATPWLDNDEEDNY